MIGLDTNVLVRSLTQDDPSQARLPTELIERRFSCVIERLLQAAELVVQDEQEVFTAMVALKEGRGSFADALIGVFGPAPVAPSLRRSIARRCGCPGLLCRSA